MGSSSSSVSNATKAAEQIKKQFFLNCASGDHHVITRCAEKDPTLLRTKDSTGTYGIFIAVVNNRYGAVRALLMQDPTLALLELDVDNSYGLHHSQPIHYTCMSYEKLDILKLLVESKADINATCNQSSTPLTLALNSGYIKSATYLISEGAKINDTNPAVVPSIHSCPSFEIFKLLVENNADLSCLHPHTNGTILHTYVQKPGFLNRETLQYILSRFSFSLDHQDNNNETAMGTAVNYGNLEVIKALVEAKANLTVGNSVLEKAMAYSNHPITSYLLEQPELFPPVTANTMVTLINSIYSNRDSCKKIILTLLQRGLCGLDMVDPNQNHNIIFTIFNQVNDQDLDWFQSIILVGVNVNVKDPVGLSLLHKAVQKGIVFVTLLLKYGADPNITDNRGSTPIFLAAQTQKLDIVKLLYEHGSNILHKDNAGTRVTDWIVKVPAFNDFVAELKLILPEEVWKTTAETPKFLTGEIKCWLCGATPASMVFYLNNNDMNRNDDFRVRGYSAVCVPHKYYGDEQNNWIFAFIQ
eukprot:TRINITY_DN13326_c0_g1_i1.p1 TRINITY_DN13326_c0_g1~~TRINITY_DN13326_c0_g1_i1.p1  ORF type:complete len:528 (-),score=84.91 TRINITY_DN13326_c0_g1_i1:26-1609(-)